MTARLYDAMSGWHPIASVDDLVPLHVFLGDLLGREFAVWRADDGFVNVWENRCLHRGVRLTLGICDGRELKCQYHGWRYANRTAGCTYIPAHPADAPARTIANRTFPSLVRHGLVWTTLAPGAEAPALEGIGGDPLVLRAVPVEAPADLAMCHIAGYAFQPGAALGETGAAVDLLAASDRIVMLRFAQGGGKPSCPIRTARRRRAPSSAA